MYKNTTIYLIGCKDTNIPNTYVGHTTNFKQRCEDHENCVTTSDRKLYSFIRNHGGWSNWYMKPLSTISCKNKCEAALEELYWYMKMDATLNVCTPGLYYFNRSMRSDRLYEKRKGILDRIVTEARYPPQMI
jgi:predicted GIY-YIG superfamily endonuclease